MLVEDREHHIFKLLFIILFWVFFRVATIVMVIISLIQWVSLWFQDEPRESLLKFSSQLTLFQMQITKYLTFQSDDKVFPFADWPDAPASAEAPVEATEPVKTPETEETVEPVATEEEPSEKPDTEK